MDLTDFCATLLPGQTGEHRFSATSLPLDSPSIYGGQLMAQAMGAAAQTLPTQRPAHYLQASFLARGNPSGELHISVSHARDGRSTSHRLVTIEQQERTLVIANLSFQDAATGLEHQIAMPSADTPEALLRDPDTLIDFAPEASDFPFLIVEQPGGREPQSLVWARPHKPFNGDALLHQMLFAFLSDSTILQSALRAHALGWDEPDLLLATMNHAIWFHRTIDINRWLLMHSESPATAGGRALANANTYEREGALVASIAQEGVLRERVG